MTVKELRQKLSDSDFEENAKVVVHWGRNRDSDCLEIRDVAMASGTPDRGPRGKSVFKFDRGGLAKWIFIKVEEG